MSMSRVIFLVGALAVGAAACGGGGDDDGATADPSAGPPASSPTTSQPPASSAPESSEGAVEAASDLSEFVCEPGKGGVWNASGVITNSSGRSADYRVTVVVAVGPGVSAPGKRRTLTELAPGAPEPFDIDGLPGGAESDSTCQVEVLRLP
jgi:hypothetical protein